MKAKTLGALKAQTPKPIFRSVKDEIRENLIAHIQSGKELFPGIVGYEETAIPAIINALLSRHNFILLGLRGQAKSRILRALTDFLDEEIPSVEGCEIRDDPFFPLCGTCRRRLGEEADELPIRWVPRQERYVEKLATPDVTIADILGDLDPIKAARKGRDLADQENIHFGLLPRAHRGIFAVNELPDLAPKIQVGLFNIMQEGDVQIKGFPLRLPLDLLLVFSANPEDYTARGKIVTPLKDRIGSEIRTHYPGNVEDGMRITHQESWISRDHGVRLHLPDFVPEIVEEVAFAGRQDKRVDQASGVSQRLPISCLENCLSNAERRALEAGHQEGVVRILDVFAAAPSITGKLELEYEGEMKGAEKVAGELIQRAIRKSFDRRFSGVDFERIIQWFELGGELQVTDRTGAEEYLSRVQDIQGLPEILSNQDISAAKEPEMAVALVEFILEGLVARRKLSRNQERGYHLSARRSEEDFFADLERRRRSFN